MAAVALQGDNYRFNPVLFPSAATIEASIERIRADIFYNSTATIGNVEFDTGAQEWSIAHFISPVIPPQSWCDSMESFSQKMTLAGAAITGLIAIALAYVGWSILLMGLGSITLFLTLQSYNSSSQPQDLQKNDWMQRKWCRMRQDAYDSITPAYVDIQGVIEEIEKPNQRLLVPNDVVVIHYLAMQALQKLRQTQIEVAAQLGSRSPKPLDLISSRIVDLKDPRIAATYQAFFPNMQWPTEEDPDAWMTAYFEAIKSDF